MPYRASPVSPAASHNHTGQCLGFQNEPRSTTIAAFTLCEPKESSRRPDDPVLVAPNGLASKLTDEECSVWLVRPYRFPGAWRVLI